MVNQQLTEAAKHTALKNGADLVGVVNVISVPIAGSPKYCGSGFTA
jgi:hypothetical protein